MGLYPFLSFFPLWAATLGVGMAHCETKGQFPFQS